jgi:sec-independent protein translocase protein TatC
MATRRLRPIGHEDRLSVVDHLDELRNRLIVCASVLVVAFGFCFWQNAHLLNALNSPLHHLSKTARNHISGITGDQVGERGQLLDAVGDLELLARSSTLAPGDRAVIAAAASHFEGAAKALPAHTPGVTPLTIGVGEPFTVSLTVSFYFAILISLPVLLYELFAFIVPAMRPREKAIALPIMTVAPVLFFAGAVFTYFIVLPAAIKFLQGYNASQFQALVQAQPLYSFEVLTMAAIGLAFEMPLVLLGLRQAGIINGSTLTRHWRYATVIIAVIAAAMPGADPVTTGLETAPLVILFLASIILLRAADRRDAKRAAAELVDFASSSSSSTSDDDDEA